MMHRKHKQYLKTSTKITETPQTNQSVQASKTIQAISCVSESKTAIIVNYFGWWQRFIQHKKIIRFCQIAFKYSCILGKKLIKALSYLWVTLMIGIPVVVLCLSIWFGNKRLFQYKIVTEIDLTWDNLSRYADYHASQNVGTAIREVRSKLDIYSLLKQALGYQTKYYMLSEKEINAVIGLLNQNELVQANEKFLQEENGFLGSKQKITIALNDSADLFLKSGKQRHVIFDAGLINTLDIFKSDNIIQSFPRDALANDILTIAYVLVSMLVWMFILVVPVSVLISSIMWQPFVQNSIHNHEFITNNRYVCYFLARIPLVFYCTALFVLLRQYNWHSYWNTVNVASWIMLSIVLILQFSCKIDAVWRRVKCSFLKGLYALGYSNVDIICRQLLPLSAWKIMAEICFAMGWVLGIIIPFVIFNEPGVYNVLPTYNLFAGLGLWQHEQLLYASAGACALLLLIIAIFFTLGMYCEKKFTRLSYFFEDK